MGGTSRPYKVRSVGALDTGSTIFYKLISGPNCSGKFITLKKLFLAYTVQNEELILKWKRKFTSLKEDKRFHW